LPRPAVVRARGALRSILIVGLLASCASDRGYRFDGRYDAPRSGYRLLIVARGYVAAGFDIADHAFARVRVCPLVPGVGKPLRFSLTRRPEMALLFESEEILTADAHWSEKMFGALLQSRGYAGLTAMELAGGFKVIAGALSGPKGAILPGQIDSLTVVQAQAEYSASDLKSQPPRDWVRDFDLPECDAKR
jgi:hypothetical protein